MKSLIKKPARAARESNLPAKPRHKPAEQAQCCAKVSRTVAGCHD